MNNAENHYTRLTIPSREIIVIKFTEGQIISSSEKRGYESSRHNLYPGCVCWVVENLPGELAG